MKIVLAFDSFKGCMTANEACHTAALAIHELLPEADIAECPLSDGGEGLVDCIERIYSSRTGEHHALRRVHVKVHDPLMNIIDASYTVCHDTGQRGPVAYMEMASASGLTLVPNDKRNPLLTTTYGVGDMIIDAVRHGCKQIVMGIGGSATCDGGKGMIKCLKDNGYLNGEYKPANDRLQDCRILVVSDVTNPLYGTNGAACVFAPQKGASPEQVETLDTQLRCFARETEALGLASPQMAEYPGAGAAGGLGYGLMVYLNAELKSGIDSVLDIAHFNATISDADLIITGEGHSDEQTLMGKVPQGVLRHANRRVKAIPVWLISGGIDDKDGGLANSFSLVRSINDGDPRPTEILMQKDNAQGNLGKTIKELIKTRIICNRK